MTRTTARTAALSALTLALLAVAPAANAQDASAALDDASAQTASEEAGAAASPHPAGVAERPGEAPGSTGLVPLPGERLPPNTQIQPGANDPAASRAMSFSAGGGECRDTIPGGPVLAAAYAFILVLLGLYALILGRKNSALAAQLDELERLLAKKSPAEADEPEKAKAP